MCSIRVLKPRPSPIRIRVQHSTSLDGHGHLNNSHNPHNPHNQRCTRLSLLKAPRCYHARLFVRLGFQSLYIRHREEERNSSFNPNDQQISRRRMHLINFNIPFCDVNTDPQSIRKAEDEQCNQAVLRFFPTFQWQGEYDIY
jgi:hypothetical protein